jgi:hypothetical protein
MTLPSTAITRRHRRSATVGVVLAGVVLAGVFRARSQPARTVDSSSASTRTSSRHTVLATGIRPVKPSRVHAGESTCCNPRLSWSIPG